MINKLAFIGAGSMSEAIISGVLKAGFVESEQIIVTNKNNQERLERLEQIYQIKSETNKQTAIQQADIIILSMKPYDLKVALTEIRTYLKRNQLIITVIAGVATDYIMELVGKEMPIVRVMPNTSASIGLSATAISLGRYATADHLEIVNQLFQTIGTTVVVDEEAMHTVTSISGSGPAYIYYLVEAMEKAAMDSGLDYDVAKKLISQTVIGAGQMLKSSGEPANVLRRKITSKAGTTEAGIAALNKYDFQKTVIECVKSARDRSIELGKME